MKTAIKQRLKKYTSLYKTIKYIYHFKYPIIAVFEKIQYQFLRIITLVLYDKYSNEYCCLIDVTKISHHDHGTGIQRVVRNLVLNLINIDSGLGLVKLTAGSGEIIWASHWMRKALKLSLKDKIRYVLSIPRIDHASKYIILDALWQREKILRRKIFPRLSDYGVAVVTVIYDLIPVKHSIFCTRGHVRDFLNFLNLVIRYSSMLMCISKSIESEVKSYIKDKYNSHINPKICSWPLGFELGDQNTIGRKNNLIAKIEGCNNYLMVGTINEHKGHDIVIEAFKRLWKSGFDANLCIVGQRGWNDDYFERCIESVDTDKFYYLGQLDDDSLDFVYQNSKCLIQASYTEGYGLPVVEAASRGLGIIASDIPVMREVTEGKAIFFSVGSSEHLYNVLKGVEEGKYKISGTSDFRIYSWHESALEFLNKVNEY